MFRCLKSVRNFQSINIALQIYALIQLWCSKLTVIGHKIENKIYMYSWLTDKHLHRPEIYSDPGMKAGRGHWEFGLCKVKGIKQSYLRQGMNASLPLEARGWWGFNVLPHFCQLMKGHLKIIAKNYHSNQAFPTPTLLTLVKPMLSSQSSLSSRLRWS